jgi:plasmid replication initiation protein
MVNLKDKSKKYVATKNIISDLMKAFYRLSEIERAVILYIIMIMQNKDNSSELIKINLKTFTEESSMTSNISSDSLVKTLFNLCKKTMLIESEESRYKTTWVSSIEYLRSKQYIDIELTYKAKSSLTLLNETLSDYINNEDITLRSIYAKQIYSLIKSKRGQESIILTLKELRDLTNIKPKEYKLYSDIKRRVLLQAIKEINRLTSVEIEFEEIKARRKVEAIRIIVSYKDCPRIENVNSIVVTSVEERKIEQEEYNYKIGPNQQFSLF